MNYRELLAATAQIGDASRRRLMAAEAALAFMRQGELHAALVAADICCHERVPYPEDLALRATILERLGFSDLAIGDYEAAYDINPTLPILQLRRLERIRSQGPSELAIKSVRSILKLHPRADVTRGCFEILRDWKGFSGLADLRVNGDGIEVEVLASEPLSGEFNLRFDQRQSRVLVRTTPDHPKAGVLGFGATLRVPWPRGSTSVLVVTTMPVTLVRSSAFRPRYVAGQPGREQSRDRGTLVRRDCTIIVPVYAGREATLRCLDSVVRHTDLNTARLVIVDDCSPDPTLASELAGYASDRSVVLRNPINLGFIGSINRAMSLYPHGDVVLLNADTIVPEGWLQRLKAALAHDPNVGTVTPLSNNGEITSVPRPFEVSPVPTATELEAINTALISAYSGKTVAIPNGVGFCLLISEECRAATGLLNDVDFADGYVEEVEYCLRASERGFKHVCALDVYVGHEGGLSFADRKRALVVRNIQKLEHMFPSIRTDTFHFMRSHPLAPVADLIQLALIQRGPSPVLKGTLRITRKATVAGTSGTIDDEGVLLEYGEDGTIVLASRQLLSPANLRIAPRTKDHARIVQSLPEYGFERVILHGPDHPDWVWETFGRFSCAREIVIDRRPSAPGDLRNRLDALAGVSLRVTSRGLAQDLDFAIPYTVSLRPLTERSRRPDDFDVVGGPKCIAVLSEAFGQTELRTVHSLAGEILRERLPIDLLVVGDDGALQNVARKGVVRMLHPPRFEAIEQSLRARGAVAIVHLCEENIAASRWSQTLAATGVPVFTQSPYIRESLAEAGCDVPDADDDLLMTFIRSLAFPHAEASQ